MCVKIKVRVCDVMLPFSFLHTVMREIQVGLVFSFSQAGRQSIVPVPVEVLRLLPLYPSNGPENQKKSTFLRLCLGYVVVTVRGGVVWCDGDTSYDS